MDPNSESEYSDEEKGDQKQQNFHILAVDDSQIDRKLLEKLLTVSSYQVTCVDSGDKALEYLGLLDNIEETNEPGTPSPASCPSSFNSSHQDQASNVNLIITDYNMPGITGYDLLKRVKDSSRKDIPVIVVSSENVPSRINMCLEGGAQEFLLKPVRLSDLSKIHSYLLNSSCHYTTVDHNHDSFICSNGKKATSTTQSDIKPRLKELSVS